ncbi:MAG TPA: hypothetical protein VD864_05295, partial [Nocardioides sp.]|nr:hypothetical protein [Nocardioides sp.]
MKMMGTRRWALAAVAVIAAGGLTACGGSDSDGDDKSSGASGGGGLTTVTYWDPYPQYDASSDWAAYVSACAPEGMTLERTSIPNGDILNELTTAVKEDNAPDVVLLDNPAVPDAAVSGLLAPADEAGIDTEGP